MKHISLSANKISILKILLSVTLLIFCSKITVPFYPVPVTLQMFAIYFLSLKFSPKESFGGILLWLVLGICGLPVFAPNVVGNFFSRPTAGYLMGMLFGAPISGFLKSKGFNSVLCCFVCYLIVHLFGCLYLMKFVAVDILRVGFYPFIIPEILKIFSVCTVYKLTEK